MNSIKSSPRGVLARRLVVLLSAALAVPAIASAQAIVFSENFESPTWTVGQALANNNTSPNGWNGTDNGTTLLSRIAAPVAGGTQMLHLLDNINSNAAFATKSLGTTITQGYIQFDLHRPVGATDNAYVILTESANVFGTTYATFAMTSSQVEIRVGGMTTKTATFASLGIALGEWNTFRLTFDKTANILGFSLNGTSISALSVVASDAPSATFQMGGMRLVSGYGGGTGVNNIANFDNIQVFDANAAAIPEPGVFAAAAGACMLAVAAVRRRRRTA